MSVSVGDFGSPLSPSRFDARVLQEESKTPSTTLRVLGAALWLPVSHHVSNVETELQAEAVEESRTSPVPLLGFSCGASSAHAVECSSVGGLASAPATFLSCSKLMLELKKERALLDDMKASSPFSSGADSQLLNAQRLRSKKICELAEKRAKDEVEKLQAWCYNLSEKKLLCSQRGAAGETLLLFAYLIELYDFARWLLTIEPMLIAGCYTGSKYEGENVLHVLASKPEAALGARGQSLAEIRHLAHVALHQYASKGSIATGANDADSWEVLRAFEVMSGTTLLPEWRASWLRCVWIDLLVNGLARGTFFEPIKLGGACFCACTCGGMLSE